MKRSLNFALALLVIMALAFAMFAVAGRRRNGHG